MTSRADFLAVQLRNSLSMDSERRAFAGQVMDVVRGDIARWQVPGPLLAELIIRDLEPVYGRWYGRFPGDLLARWYRFIVEETFRAKAAPIQWAIEDIQRRLPAPIWRAIEREAATGFENAA